MSRQLRLEYPGAFYHVMSHGTGNLWLYKTPDDFQDFLELLLDVKNKYKLEFHTLILMMNHYHFIVETPFENLSKGMNYFNGELAKRYNKRYKRKGAVFRSRYKAILIDQDNYYQNVYRYINQNALRIKIVDKVEEYQGGLWYYLEKGGKSLELMTELINWSSVKSRLCISNLHKIKDWVNEELERSPHAGQKYEYLLGAPSWIENIKKKYVDPLLLPKDFNQKSRIEKATSDIWKKFKILKDYKDHPEYLNILIYLLWEYSSLDQSQIAEKLRLSNNNVVCCRLYRFKNRLKEDKKLEKLLKKIET